MTYDIGSLIFSVFNPPTVLAGIIIIFSTMGAARLYPYAKNRLKCASRGQIKFNDESFGIRALATGISLASLYAQSFSVQPLSPLTGPGIGQLYITLGLTVSFGIIVSNLKQRLDSYIVIPEAQPQIGSIEQTLGVNLSESEWAILKATKDSYPDGITNSEITNATKLEGELVLRGLNVLVGLDLIEIMDQPIPRVMAVRITGSGVLLLRSRKRQKAD